MEGSCGGDAGLTGPQEEFGKVYKADAPCGEAGHLLGGAGGLCSREGAREEKEDRVLAENLALTQAKGSVVWALGSSVSEGGRQGGACSREAWWAGVSAVGVGEGDRDPAT